VRFTSNFDFFGNNFFRLFTFATEIDPVFPQICDSSQINMFNSMFGCLISIPWTALCKIFCVKIASLDCYFQVNKSTYTVSQDQRVERIFELIRGEYSLSK
jgi:hypothetical protein